MTDTGNIVIGVRNVTRSFGAKCALDNVSLVGAESSLAWWAPTARARRR